VRDGTGPEGAVGRALAVALLGEGWPHTLPLCLALGVARQRGADLVEVPFLGLRAEQRRWSLLVGAALAVAGMARAWQTSWGVLLRPARMTWEVFPWGWLKEYALLAAARMRREGWQMEAMAGRGLRFRGAKGEIWLLWAPPGRAWRAGLREGSGLQAALVSPLPWEERVPAGMAVLAPPEVGPWLARALR
jgi:hypothetical protein